MKRLIGILSVAAICIFTQNAIAQNLKFGHINRNELIQAMPEFDSARVALERLNKELSDASDQLQVEFISKGSEKPD
jgi:outer membrane protein